MARFEAGWRDVAGETMAAVVDTEAEDDDDVVVGCFREMPDAVQMAAKLNGEVHGGSGKTT